MFFKEASKLGKKEDRLKQIMDYLSKNQAASVKELSELLKVTEMTIRRDFSELNDDNKILLIQGVAVKNNASFEKEYLLDIEERTHIAEKEKIGNAAAQMVEENDIIFVDSGTTIGYLLKALKGDMPLTIITNCLQNISIIQNKPKWDLIVPGGMLQRNSMTLVENNAAKYLANVRLNKSFFSATGVSSKLGVTCPYLYECGLKSAALNHSDQTILVADYSKFDKISVAHFANIEQFDYIVTDKKITKKYIDLCTDKGVKTIITD
jgi:DeoR family deoxyribose operon repressor